MLNCEICLTHQASFLFTRCCKSIICPTCCDRVDKKLVCTCGRPLPQGRKNYSDSPEVLDILRRFVEKKQKQCDRCDGKAQCFCEQCDMLYCQTCNAEVHAGVGFAKHERRKISNNKSSVQYVRKRQAVCPQHNQLIAAGCECGAALCVTCSKHHKQSCTKGFRTKGLKEFKQEYNLNVLLKMRQLSFFKERLSEDRDRYIDHFKVQQNSFQTSQRLICQQFQYLYKLIEIKYSEIKSRLSQYWKSCENVYSTSIVRINTQIKKYDSYAELLQLFSQNFSNLDYFQKKIKKYSVNFDCVNIKSLNIDHSQSSILSIAIAQKLWQQSGNDIQIPENVDIKQNYKQQARLFGNVQNASQLILDYTHNPMKDRQLNLVSSHSEIYFSFIHLPYQNLKYEVEYGVGMKIKGQQIFKRMSNTSGYGIVEGLNSNTKYRVRMRIADAQWGTVSEITTLDHPKFNLQTSLCAKSVGENSVQLGKGGIIYGSNQIHFGVHRWVIKFTSKSISYEDSETACMSIGVSNKQTKKAIFVGTTLNYGYQKSEIVLKILLDCNQKRLTIINSTSSHEQTYQNLPNFPLFPTIQNRGNAQILVRYNLTNDDTNSC